jgi:hypothetical protein
MRHHEDVKIGMAGVGAFVLFAWAILPGRGEGRTVLAKGLFSYQAPAGWTTGESPLSPYPVSSEGFGQPHEASIRVNIEASPRNLPDYVDRWLKALRDGPDHAHILDRRPFVTAAQLDGVRVVTEIRNLRQILYFFDGGSGQIIVVNACCLIRHAGHDTPLFDASLKTFSLE